MPIISRRRLPRLVHRADGLPSPMGATWIPELEAFNIAVYSHHATAVAIEVFRREAPATVVARFELDPRHNKTGRVWHCLIPHAALDGADLYGLRVDGPWNPSAGHRFDPTKVLLDPYATEVWFPPEFSREAARGPGDNVGRAPLAVLRQEAVVDYPAADRPHERIHDAIIYELHVRGFTISPTSGVEPANRGTFAGLTEKIPYLQDLGVTVVELLPVQQFDPEESNYWGYMTLGFFAPHRGYAASDDPVEEFRSMVAAFHRAGIEVLLDVVYNHTTELGGDGPTYSFRGIDNKSYYLLDREDHAEYVNDAGCGNVTRAGHGAVRRLVVESVRYWSRRLGVDGFRFDLASLLARDADGTVRRAHAPLVGQLTDEANRADLRLVAEAWDLRSFLMGKTFPGYSWGQWNGWFRDDVRSFLRGDHGKVGHVMRRLYGSDDAFPDTVADAYRPNQSINLLTSHDGFCLYDLVAYDTKHNAANGHGNTDGMDDNRSWNCGWEGEEAAPPEVLAMRQRQMRNAAAFLLLSNGTPMFTAGDEFGRTQGGNNNPYNQDNETTWLDWRRLEQHRELHRFWKVLIAFRKAHHSIGRGRYWRDDVQWFGATGAVEYAPWSRTFAYHLCGASEHDDDLYAMVNGHDQAVTFRVQVGTPADWLVVMDTAAPSPHDIVEPGDEAALPSLDREVAARSIVLLRRPLTADRSVTSGG